MDELRTFKAQTSLVLDYKRLDGLKVMRKIFPSSAKLVLNDSDIYKVFRSMHQSVMMKIKNSVSKD